MASDLAGKDRSRDRQLAWHRAPADVAKLFDEVEEALGHIDVVFANAADAIVKPLPECTDEPPRVRWRPWYLSF
jgi:hypothetical protein